MAPRTYRCTIFFRPLYLLFGFYDDAASTQVQEHNIQKELMLRRIVRLADETSMQCPRMGDAFRSFTLLLLGHQVPVCNIQKELMHRLIVRLAG